MTFCISRSRHFCDYMISLLNIKSHSLVGLQVSRPRQNELDLDKMNSSLETMVSISQHWLHQFQLVIENSLKGATNYGNRATDVGTKHAVLRPRLGLETWKEVLITTLLLLLTFIALSPTNQILHGNPYNVINVKFCQFRTWCNGVKSTCPKSWSYKFGFVKRCAAQ